MTTTISGLKTLTATLAFALVPALGFGQPAATTHDQHAAAAQSTQQQPAAKAHTLTRAELDELLAKPDQVLLIDVRRPDELSSIGGFAVYLSIQVDSLEKSLASIPRDRTIVTVSNHAARAARAADLLTEHGFKVAGAVGAQTYEQEGGKLTKIVAPPPRVANTGQ